MFCLAAGFGAVARYLLDRAVQAEVGSPFPWGTLVVNLTGCVALGALVGVARRNGVSDDALWSFGTGGLGAFTTFSTVSVQVVQMADTDAGPAARYLTATLVGGAAAASLGLFAAEWL